MIQVFSPALLKQLWLTLAASLAYLGIGLVRGYSASAIPSMRESDPYLIPTPETASWASAIPPLGAFFGSLLAGPVMLRLGCRRTLMIVSPLWTAAWCIIATSSQPWMLITGRILTGVMVGAVLPTAQIYVSECCAPEIRGVLGSLPSLFMSGGILLSYIMGNWLAWNHLAWCSAGIVGLLLFMVFPLPESPVWLTSKGRLDTAESSRKWLHLLHSSKTEIVLTIQNEKNHHDREKPKTNKEIRKANRPPKTPLTLKVLKSRSVLQPLGIGLAVLALQQFSGIDAVIFFTVDIFRNSGSSLDGHLATILVGIVQLVCNGISLLLIDRYGRKPLLIVSGAIMAIAMASMGTAFYLNKHGNDSIGYLPVGSLIVFMVGFSVGFGCIPFLLIGELFPAAHRSSLSGIAGSFNLGAMFLVIKSYHNLEDLITSAGTFWLYSCLCAISIAFVIFCVPETKGKSLDEIEEIFKKKKPITRRKSETVEGAGVGEVKANEEEQGTKL